MPEEKQFSLNHFATLRLLPSFWALPGAERRERLGEVARSLGRSADVLHLYQSHPIDVGADLLFWSAIQVGGTGVPKDFFVAWGKALQPLRPFVEIPHVLWGFTRPSLYSKAKSSQEIDPFTKERSPYLVMYPFTKTAEWYLFDQDTRQQMMNEHMRIGKQYRTITQLLLYSFGLQDQEFVVVYETEDLQRFSQLVYDLRATEARKYTKEDTPLHTGVHRTLEEIAGFVA